MATWEQALDQRIASAQSRILDIIRQHPTPTPTPRPLT